MRRSLARTIGSSAILVGALGASGCNVLLGLDQFTDECPEVKEGKPCPKKDGGGGGNTGLCSPGEKAECYSGDEATKGRGVCRAGTKTCGSNGLFGACEGEVTPAKEDACGNGLDDDCNGKADDACPCEPGKSYGCYSADEATKGVGNCREGKHVCLEDGLSFGECTGDVTPKDEDYEAKGDENCDGIPSGETIWVTVVGKPPEAPFGYARITGVVADTEGDIYIAGSFNGTVTVGSKTIERFDPKDPAAFLGRLDGKTGDAIWLKWFEGLRTGSGSTGPTSLAIDASTGHVLMAGASVDGFEFDAPGGSVPPRSVYVAAFTPLGDVVWSRACLASASTVDRRVGVVADASGEVTLLTNFDDSTASCGTKSVDKPLDAGSYLFLAHFDQGHTIQWLKGWGDPSTTKVRHQFPGALVAAPDGPIWLTASVSGTVKLEPFTQIGPYVSSEGANPDMALVQLDSSGELLFHNDFGSSGTQAGYGLVVDSGSVHLIGRNDGTVDFGAGPVEHEGVDAVVAAFDLGAAISHSWTHKLGGAAATVDARTVGVQPGGDVLLAGSAQGKLDFGTGAFSTGLTRHGFLMRLRPSAPGSPKLVWAKYYHGGDMTDDQAYVIPAGMALTPRKGASLRDIVVAGSFGLPTDFGRGVIGPALGDTSKQPTGFVMKVAP